MREVEYYRKLAEHARRESIRALFLQMAEESLGHKENLLKLFRRLYPGEEPVKVEAPPVEVTPFYPKFETINDYLEALEYCMEGELFAWNSYEIFSSKGSRRRFKNSAYATCLNGKDHYLRLKRLIIYSRALRAEKLRSYIEENLEFDGYLFSDKYKARYVFLDLIKNGERYIFKESS